MEKYAIFLDIDGTLLPHGTSKVPSENIRAINEAIQNGHYVFVNTGRAYDCIPDYIKNDIALSGFVAGLGTNIVYNNKTVKSVVVEKEKLKKSFEILQQAGTSCLYEGENMCIGFGEKSNKIWHEWMKGNEIFSAEEFDTKFAHARISKITVIPKTTPEYTQKLQEYFDVIEMASYMEVATVGYTKGKGMLEAAGLLGVKQENCVAMGDSENDLTMLETAGISVVMGDGVEEMKKIADFVSTSCKDGGVAYAIDKLVLKK